MEFGALICKPKDPNCNDCCLKRNCKYLKSNSKINFSRKKIIKNKNYDIFCYINKDKKIALTQKKPNKFFKKF